MPSEALQLERLVDDPKIAAQRLKPSRAFRLPPDPLSARACRTYPVLCRGHIPCGRALCKVQSLPENLWPPSVSQGWGGRSFATAAALRQVGPERSLGN